MKGKTPILVFSVIALFAVTFFAFAAFPATPYAPGDTLDPACSPGDTNCYVRDAPAGTTTLIQYNDGGAFSATTSLNFNATTTRFGIGTSSPYAALAVVGQIVGAYFTGTTTATSTFGGSLSVTEANATSTFAGGIDLSDGCFAIDGTCLTSGSLFGQTWELTGGILAPTTTVSVRFPANFYASSTGLVGGKLTA